MCLPLFKMLQSLRRTLDVEKNCLNDMIFNFVVCTCINIVSIKLLALTVEGIWGVGIINNNCKWFQRREIS